jgi:HD-GYP domain-containing protein (c-di-GMP phosphodiesterase class II)
VVLRDGRFYGTLCCANHEVKIDLSDRDVQMLHVLARLTADQIERDELQREKQRLLAETAGVTALIAAVEARDSYTGEHSHSVVELATKVATGMGMRREALAEIQQVALLHDIGKLAIPDAVLNKPGPLSPDEWRAMREHPMIGGRIVSAIPELMHLGPAIRAEHERWDGRGYPDGLAGRAIPAASRIVFVCDAYHAMTSDRPYREALSNKAAIKEIFAGAGRQFCPETARALLKLLADEALA